ncbi:Transaldolase [Mycena sanguinolenta]|uniref:Transaldolase n=1 Tax=Mycena sanguinolenta TaxID=230812 RepID=A0A8H7CT56_9AGAR|nr:Transaldolase [Mycena sanguinolenta]
MATSGYKAQSEPSYCATRVSVLPLIRRNSIVSCTSSLVGLKKNFVEINEFQEDLTDATTNPSLVLAAVSKPEYAHVLQDAVDFARRRLGPASVREQTAVAMDRALVQVGVNIARIVPGRVSVSVDPRIGYDTLAIINKSKILVALLEELEIPRSRILIKIPATYEGICAAQALEHPSAGEPIHTNMTLIFSRVQAIACAQAGVSVISPFIGRVKDWWDSQGGPRSQELSQHPGILLVRDIRSTYAAHGWGGKTHIMAAGFRAVEEIVEVGKYGVEGGPDLVTLPPHLLNGLRSRENVEPRPKFDSVPVDLAALPEYFASTCNSAQGASLYAQHIMEEKIAAVKVAEGLAKFSADAQVLEDLLKRRVMESTVEVLAVL